MVLSGSSYRDDGCEPQDSISAESYKAEKAAVGTTPSAMMLCGVNEKVATEGTLSIEKVRPVSLPFQIIAGWSSSHESILKPGAAR